MKKGFWMFLLILGAGLIFAGCASAPTAEINATKSAISSAQTEDVQTYAPESLKAAEDQLNQALAEVQTQDGKFAMSRDYKKASELLKSAKDAAEKAVSDAQAAKAQCKSDAEALIAALPQTIADAKAALAKAPKGKDTKADLEAMQNDLKLAEESLNEATQAMGQEKFKEALTKATSAKEKASAVINQVQQALEKIRGGRKA
jgi:hypothetical protein